MCGSHSHRSGWGKLVAMGQAVKYHCTYCNEYFDTYDECGRHTVEAHQGYWPVPIPPK
ncbi:hypothetical protein H4R18_005365 [Coemansia javaensis]|uniref:C2H2-type domain-containing protein n=1 Tax=Coemansia javaensis TaxID=2761396 RepID=A0A9W8H9D9_9FUNG|nr:hypothetical protein H4R18_005365 [Coemansia javaensis]